MSKEEMQRIDHYLQLSRPRFRCRDTSGERELVVDLTHELGPPASEAALQKLRDYAGDEYEHLVELYRRHDGMALHVDDETAGLLIPSIDELAEIAADYRSWFEEWDEDQFYPFQLTGKAFATIDASGNYFVVSDGEVYYSDHDGGDDSVWARSPIALVERALRDPVAFLSEAGCYTRYADGMTLAQYIPEEFLHD